MVCIQIHTIVSVTSKIVIAFSVQVEFFNSQNMLQRVTRIGPLLWTHLRESLEPFASDFCWPLTNCLKAVVPRVPERPSKQQPSSIPVCPSCRKYGSFRVHQMSVWISAAAAVLPWPTGWTDRTTKCHSAREPLLLAVHNQAGVARSESSEANRDQTRRKRRETTQILEEQTQDVVKTHRRIQTRWRIWPAASRKTSICHRGRDLCSQWQEATLPSTLK